jgi:hypothetical protein
MDVKVPSQGLSRNGKRAMVCLEVLFLMCLLLGVAAGVLALTMTDLPLAVVLADGLVVLASVTALVAAIVGILSVMRVR